MLMMFTSNSDDDVTQWHREQADIDPVTRQFLGALKETLEDAVALAKKYRDASWIKRFFR